MDALQVELTPLYPPEKNSRYFWAPPCKHMFPTVCVDVPSDCPQQITTHITGKGILSTMCLDVPSDYPAL